MSRRVGLYLPWTNGKEKESFLTDFRLAKGIYLRELAEMTGMRLTDITNLDSGITSPLISRGIAKGEVKPEVIKLCKLLGTTPEEVFPRYICRITASKTLPEGFLTDISHSTYDQWATKSPEIQYEAYDFARKLVELEVISKMQLGVLLARQDGLTLEEIGAELGVTRERIRQMEVYTEEVIHQWVNTGRIPKCKRFTGEYVLRAKATERGKGREKGCTVVHRKRCAPIVGTKRPRGRPKKSTTREPTNG